MSSGSSRAPVLAPSALLRPYTLTGPAARPSTMRRAAATRARAASSSSTGVRSRAIATTSALTSGAAPIRIVTGGAPSANDALRLQEVAVDLVVHLGHRRLVERRAHAVQHLCDLRVGVERVLAHDRHDVVGRPQVPVV